MSWVASLLVVFLTAVAGAIGGGLVAGLSVGWYRISSREGLSGYFIVGMGLVGLVAGAMIGLVVSRTVAGSASPGTLNALGISLALVVAVAGSIAAVARGLADVPPEIDGEQLWLVVEVRFPPGEKPIPADGSGDSLLRLGAAGRMSRTVRARRTGILWTEDARQEDGRWVVPGAVGIFTGRGRRTLEIELGGKTVAGFLVPLPARPGKASFSWSEWLPRPRRDGGAPFTLWTYRFRVRKRSEPIRTETFGPFEVDTMAQDLFESASKTSPPLTATSRFSIRHRGQPVRVRDDAPTGSGRSFEAFDSVMTVAAGRPALLVCAVDDEGSGKTFLLVEEDGKVRATFTGDSWAPTEVFELTSDPARFDAGRHREQARGWLDRTTLDREGFFEIDRRAVLVSRHLSVHRFTVPDDVTPIPSVPPLGLSPDDRSLVQFAYAEGSESRPVLAVTDFVAGRTSTVPIDRERMPFTALDRLDPAWVERCFVWQPGSDGTQSLVERAGGG